MKYSDYFVDQLVSMGYTHCFYVSGGNVMHLLESARTRMECIAVTHEVSAVIATEYFNVANRSTNRRAVAFVTAGPGLTNAMTGLAGAWLESRELLLVGGQARSNLMSRGTVRQIGHQEIDGVAMASSVSKQSILIDKPISGQEISRFAQLSSEGRKGPVFLEVCLDVTLMNVDFRESDSAPAESLETNIKYTLKQVDEVKNLLVKSKRPLLIVGGGLEYETFQKNLEVLKTLRIPVATTWNTADFLDYESEIYAGRPNTYGMRWANSVIQQCDLLISIGARLGLQQTGFNVENFAPLAKLVRVDIDQHEIVRSMPHTHLAIQADASDFFSKLLSEISDLSSPIEWREWIQDIKEIKGMLKVDEDCNSIYPDYVNPFHFVSELSSLVNKSDLVIPCSSGGAYTSMMQAFKQKQGNLLTNNKGLASMGYGLAGAIGTSVAKPLSRVILVEGDGGFTQNLQELGTVANQKLNLKMFIFDNGGYASIRISQKSYFQEQYMGCDSETGIQLPNWKVLCKAWGIQCIELNGKLLENREALEAFDSKGPALFVVKIHKDQPFLPKIMSKVNPDGTISSNPIHLMHPLLEKEIADRVFRFLPNNLRS